MQYIKHYYTDEQTEHIAAKHHQMQNIWYIPGEIMPDWM